MFNISSDKECLYCSACWNICPVGAIDRVRDDEKFWRVKVDSAKCIQCGACEKVCPLNNINLKTPKEFYAGYHKNKNKIIRAASGGGGTAFSERIIRLGGYVCGVKWNDDFRGARHVIVRNENELDALSGVKYVQSEKGEVFKEIKKILADKRVLFFGMPCEVAGLRSYLGKDYVNLITCDLICQGNTTDEVVNQYISQVAGDANIKDFNLRYQNIFYRDTENYILNLKLEDRTIRKPFWETDYGFAFMKYKRPECYRCRFKGGSMADITIGDCWGINKKYPCYSKVGTSVILGNTDKGVDFIRSLDNMELWKADAGILKGNRSYSTVMKADSDRTKFKELFKGENLHTAAENMRSKSIKHKIWNIVPWCVKKGILKRGKPVIPYNDEKEWRKIE